MTALSILLGAGLAALIVLLPRAGVIAQWKRVRSRREQTRSEDALKHILAWKQRSGPASLESLAGSLRLPTGTALHLATRMETAGWVTCGATGIELTPAGEQRALQVVRAHRLWERHLADDANMPIERVHQAAERAEHSLTVSQVARLDAHLGHPQHDPHGDPIPRADGRMASLDAVSLNDWPVGVPGRIAHIEDEPDAVFHEILAAGLRPSQVIDVVEMDEVSLRVRVEGKERRIDRALAINIHVSAPGKKDLPPTNAARLSAMRRGDRGEVLGLGAECTGFSRRRLLDLGLTQGARVQVALDNTFGDPRAFRVRGTTIALRRQQADQVWVRLQDSPAERQVSE